mmetsp:Transcript_23175/g.37682  ORF Transcript_23175/g.37682 Transcript_23175/m.37682 type:complete len:209 (+) Transcript_23175:103-729(+)
MIKKTIFRTTSTETVEPTKKTVSFKSTVRVFPVLHINEYSDEEVASSWWSRGEMKEIRQYLRIVVAMMNENDPKANDCIEHCTRGLEQCTSAASAAKKRRREAAIDEVLEEQWLQEENGEHDEEMIASIYQEYSGPAKTFARVLGQRDEKDVQDGLVLTEIPCPPAPSSSHSPKRKSLARSERFGLVRQESKRRLTCEQSLVRIAVSN